MFTWFYTEYFKVTMVYTFVVLIYKFTQIICEQFFFLNRRKIKYNTQNGAQVFDHKLP